MAVTKRPIVAAEAFPVLALLPTLSDNEDNLVDLPQND